MQSAKFLEGISGKLAEQWSASLLTPAFVFWSGGILVGIQRHNWGKFISEAFTYSTDNSSNSTSSLQIITILIIGFLVVATSAAVIQRFEFTTLQFLEGYWPVYLSKPRQWLLNQQIRQFQKDDTQWHNLDTRKRSQGLSTEDEYTLNYLDQRFRRKPVILEKLMPTRLGNILRASELRPEIKYGLNTIVCWPHLWMLLPEQARADISGARQMLNTYIRLWLWSVLFALVWTPFGLLRWTTINRLPTFDWSYWSLWSAVVGLVSAILAYRWLLEAASRYGDLIEAAFDLYRNALYNALRWPLPVDSAEEKTMGKQITTYLWRGTVGKPVRFQPESPREQGN